MGSLAVLAKQMGYDVKGYDGPIYPPMSELLARNEIETFERFEPAQLQPPPDLVIVGNANLPRGSEALEYVLNQKLPYTSGAEWLGNTILRKRRVIAVAGTHGKTTTTAMITWVLSNAGLDPGYLIGGVPNELEQTARLGTGQYFVVEADEYDTSYFDRRSKFLHYRPDILIITSLEFDHADIFEDLNAIQYQFQHLIRAVPGNGQIVVPFDHENIESVLEQGCWTPVTRYEISTKTNDKLIRFRTENVAPDGSEFDVVEQEHGLVGRVRWNMLGIHNVANGLAALIASYYAGVAIPDAIRHLSCFAGVKRRLEVIIRNDSTTVYSDFAHHPTAIKTTLEGVRKHVGNDHILAVIEPGTHTMSLGTHRLQLQSCCDSADEVIWFQSPRIRWDLNELLRGATVPMKVSDNIDQLTRKLCVPNDRKTHVVIMSNSAFGGIFQKIIDQFRTTHPRPT